mmetsp:Transcript_3868/g.8531  ORF Transcript_3868/g.8531 Transcript_3868/m.8531 type:complete len:85 (+) Transcript_3868:1169-1423(+)
MYPRHVDVESSIRSLLYIYGRPKRTQKRNQLNPTKAHVYKLLYELTCTSISFIVDSAEAVVGLGWFICGGMVISWTHGKHQRCC